MEVTIKRKKERKGSSNSPWALSFDLFCFSFPLFVSCLITAADLSLLPLLSPQNLLLLAVCL
jgi:hypothetical protein